MTHLSRGWRETEAEREEESSNSPTVKKKRGGVAELELEVLPLQLHRYPLAETFCCDGEANQTYGGTLGLKEGQDIPA